MAAIMKEHVRIDSSLPVEEHFPLAPVAPLSKPQRPKSKSLQPCRCPKEGCGKMFSKRSNLKAHMRVHSGVLPYPCEFPGCTKRFRWKSSLKPHVKVHLASGQTLSTSVCSSTTVATKDPISIAQNVTKNKGHPPATPVHEPSTPATKPLFRGSDLDLPPQKTWTDISALEVNSPGTVIDTSLFDSPVTPDSNSRQYTCSFPLCHEKFPRMSLLLEHEVMACHQGNRPQVVRALFQDSNDSPPRFTAQGEIDLSCNSVLSGSQTSNETDIVSFSLDNPVENASNSLEGSVITEDLWKTDLGVLDPFMDFPVNMGGGHKTIDLLSGDEGGAGISVSNNETVSIAEQQWMLQPGSSTSSSAAFPDLYAP